MKLTLLRGSNIVANNWSGISLQKSTMNFNFSPIIFSMKSDLHSNGPPKGDKLKP